MSLIYAARYGAEVPYYYPRFVRDVKALDIGPDTRLIVDGRHSANVGTAIFAASLYDMLRPPERKTKKTRETIKFLGGLSMWYFDLIDSAVDDPEAGLTEADKAAGLQAVANVALGEPSEL
ncbi:MAG TPA: hypothetical protein VG964_03795, partial [Candidatus Saccharimonadales bacterium]|nr:hypothetical protein [Candidatus Saccharimonadales bacterium]